MEVLWQFVGILVLLVPLVIALVKAVTDDVTVPRWGKRLLAVVFGVAVSWLAYYVAALYADVTLPWGIVTILGGALGLNAAGIYDFGNIIGSNTTVNTFRE